MTSKGKEKAGFEFGVLMENGKKYEREVQQEIKRISKGHVCNNVKIGRVCEFDVIVAEYPLITFIEVKAYRKDVKKERARTAVFKLRKHCMQTIEDKTLYDRFWYPCITNRDIQESHTVTNKELLFRKLEMEPIEGWRYRMMLIVPDKSYKTVVMALKGEDLKGGISSAYKYPTNILDIGGIPLTVISEKRIKEIF